MTTLWAIVAVASATALIAYIIKRWDEWLDARERRRLHRRLDDFLAQQREADECDRWMMAHEGRHCARREDHYR